MENRGVVHEREGRLEEMIDHSVCYLNMRGEQSDNARGKNRAVTWAQNATYATIQPLWDERNSQEW